LIATMSVGAIREIDTDQESAHWALLMPEALVDQMFYGLQIAFQDADARQDALYIAVAADYLLGQAAEVTPGPHGLSAVGADAFRAAVQWSIEQAKRELGGLGFFKAARAEEYRDLIRDLERLASIPIDPNVPLRSARIGNYSHRTSHAFTLSGSYYRRARDELVTTSIEAGFRNDLEARYYWEVFSRLQSGVARFQVTQERCHALERFMTVTEVNEVVGFAGDALDLDDDGCAVFWENGLRLACVFDPDGYLLLGSISELSTPRAKSFSNHIDLQSSSQDIWPPLSTAYDRWAESRSVDDGDQFLALLEDGRSRLPFGPGAGNGLAVMFPEATLIEGYSGFVRRLESRT
jgi:hypothetical protein